MEWLEEPTEDGTYWYVDIDFLEPIEVTTKENLVFVDGEDYLLENLKKDGAHFWGPLPKVDPPAIPKELQIYLSELDEARWD